MEKYRAVPLGFTTIGEVAKKMGVTVRTLQYYDKEGLLTPSSESAGGRRLYNDKDVIQLHQVLSLKYLGFSLEEIKNRLVSLDTPADVAAALTAQAEVIGEKMTSLSQSLKAIEILKAEVLQMRTVDFKKYADIIVNLQMKNENYWMIKHFDDTTLEHLRGCFNKESGMAFMDSLTRLWDKAIKYQKNKVLPDSIEGQNLAKEFWTLLLEFMGGDMSLFPKITEIIQSAGNQNKEWKEKQDTVNAFLVPALDVYFRSVGYNPFDEGGK